MRRTRIAFVGALAALVLTGCGSEDATTPPAAGGPGTAVTASPTAVAPTSQSTTASTPVPVPSTSAPIGGLGGIEGWFTDQDHRDDPSEGTWVAAWFAPSDGWPESVVRYWRVVDVGTDDSPISLLARSVGLLDEAPPPGFSSAFAAGLHVLGVTVEGNQVVVDLAADSPGLRGHASHGTILAESQLLAAAAHYFPDAETLCVAYDGVPTDVDHGAVFLHDAYGCPLPLPPSSG